MKIGIVSIWFCRGGGNIAVQVKDAFQKAGHEVSVLARMSETDGRKRIEFTSDYFHTDLYLYPDYYIKDSDFKNWIKRNSLDRVIFIEEHFTKNLLNVCLKLKIPCFNYVVWENINPGGFDFYKKFTKLICPVMCTYNFLQKAGVKNVIYVQWGIDIHRKFRYQEPIKKDKVQFLFLDGWGGSHNRKNPEAIHKAFSRVLPRDKTILRVHTQKESEQEEIGQGYHKTCGTISHQELIELYRQSDIILMPSRWEGNGLQQMEAFAVGRPVITIDNPPMNERVENNINGFCCKVFKKINYSGIFVSGGEIDLDDFTKKMILLSEDDELLYQMCINSRIKSEKEYDWDKNGQQLVDEVI